MSIKFEAADIYVSKFSIANLLRMAIEKNHLLELDFAEPVSITHATLSVISGIECPTAEERAEFEQGCIKVFGELGINKDAISFKDGPYPLLMRTAEIHLGEFHGLEDRVIAEVQMLSAQISNELHERLHLQEPILVLPNENLLYMELDHFGQLDDIKDNPQELAMAMGSLQASYENAIGKDFSFVEGDNDFFTYDKASDKINVRIDKQRMLDALGINAERSWVNITSVESKLAALKKPMQAETPTAAEPHRR